MDPSALIFVALAVAWAVYLIPKALEHHEEGVRTRTVDRFSARMRVLARREAVSGRKSRLVSARTRPDASSDPSGSPSTPTDLPSGSLDERPAPRAAARAARRRLRVVSLILVANLVVAGLAYVGRLGWPWCAAPVGVLVAWLVACRLMVRRERGIGRARGRRTPRLRIPAEVPAQEPTDNTEELAAVRAAGDPAPTPAREPGSWDPVPVTLPTYVSKPLAPRSVSTIDLDSTGVWSSGRSEADSELVREATARDAGSSSSSAAAARRRAVGD